MTAAPSRLTGALLALLATTSLPALAAQVSDQDLLKDAETPDNVLTYGMGYKAQRYSPLDKINKDTVKSPGPRLRLLLRRREAARPGEPAARRRRHDLRHRLLLAPVRYRQPDRHEEVAVRRPPARGHPALLRRRQPGCRALQGQGLLHHAGRPPDRAQPGDRQGRLEQEDGGVQGRVLQHGRPADRQGQGDRRQLGRRVRHHRCGQGLRRRYRRGGLVPPDRRGQCRPPERQAVDHDRHAQPVLARRHLEDWRRLRLARRHLRPRAQPPLHRHQQPGALEQLGPARRQQVDQLHARHRPRQRRDQVGTSRPRRTTAGTSTAPTSSSRSS